MSYFVVTWISGGYTGAPGYTKLKYMLSPGANATVAEANAAAANGRVLLASTAANMPTGVTYQCQTLAQSYDDAGVLTGEVTITAVPAQITGSGGTTYPGGVGAVVYWLTGALNGGHRVKGRTYFVPLANNAFASDGTLAAGLVTSLGGAAATYVGTTPTPAVNSRKLDQADRGNQTNAVISSSLKDRTAFLRTRRT